jgi:hypothetical protein
MTRERVSFARVTGGPEEAEAEADAYFRQPACTLTRGIGPRWDPWPYICSVLRPLFFFVDLLY